MLMQPTTEALWVVLYEHTTIPRWRTAAILDFDFGPLVGRRSTFLHQIWYRDGKSPAHGYPLVRNQVFENTIN